MLALAPVACGRLLPAAGDTQDRSGTAEPTPGRLTLQSDFGIMPGKQPRDDPGAAGNTSGCLGPGRFARAPGSA